MKVSQTQFICTYDFNTQGGAVGTPIQLNAPFTTPGGSNMLFVPTLSQVVVGGSLAGDATTVVTITAGLVVLFGGVLGVDPNTMTANSVFTTPPAQVIPNGSQVFFNVFVMPVTAGDFTLIVNGYFLYL